MQSLAIFSPNFGNCIFFYLIFLKCLNWAIFFHCGSFSSFFFSGEQRFNPPWILSPLIPHVSPCVMPCMFGITSFKGLTAECAEPQGCSPCVAFQLAGPCWHSRLKVRGGHGADGQSYSWIVSPPKFQGSLWGLSHISDLMAFQNYTTAIYVCGFSFSPLWLEYRDRLKNHDFLLSDRHLLGQSMAINAQRCEVRWEERGVWVLHSGIVV